MKKIILTIALSTLMVEQTSAMNPTIAITTSQLFKHLGKKAFSATMTGLHWTIAAGIPVVGGIVGIKRLADEKKTFKSCDNADETITYFVKSELKKMNVTIDAVKIEPFLGTQMATSPKHILIPRSTANELSQAIEINTVNSF